MVTLLYHWSETDALLHGKVEIDDKAEGHLFMRLDQKVTPEAHADMDPTTHQTSPWEFSIRPPRDGPQEHLDKIKEHIGSKPVGAAEQKEEVDPSLPS